VEKMNDTIAIGLGTWPEFEKEMDIYVLQDAVLAELEKCSEDGLKSEIRIVDDLSTKRGVAELKVVRGE
jgi:hypothetical protein